MAYGWIDTRERCSEVFDTPMMLPERGPATTDAVIPGRVYVDVDTFVIRTDLAVSGNIRTFVAARMAIQVPLESLPRVPA